MRTCKYTIRIEAGMRTWKPDNKATYRPWSKFVATCAALSKGGFDYAVKVARVDDWITITIAGTAGAAAVARKPVKRAHVLPAKVSPDRCAKLALEARKAALAGSLTVDRSKLRHGWYDLRRERENRKIGRAIAKAKACGETFIPARAIDRDSFGAGVHFSIGQLLQERSARPWQDYRDSARVSHMDAREARLRAFAEYKHWREMEMLSGQRQHFKPGRTDANCYSDDEVAA